MGKFHHSPDPDFDPTKSPQNKNKKKKKKVEKMKEEDFPLLSNVIRSFKLKDTLQHLLESIGEEDAQRFEASLEKLNESELRIYQKIDDLSTQRNKGKLDHSSNSDSGPTKSPPPKNKKRKKVKKTNEEKFPLLSNVVRIYEWDDTLENILKSIGEEDAESFEECFEKIYESELYIHREIDLFTDRFSQLMKTARASTSSIS